MKAKVFVLIVILLSSYSILFGGKEHLQASDFICIYERFTESKSNSDDLQSLLDKYYSQRNTKDSISLIIINLKKRLHDVSEEIKNLENESDRNKLQKSTTIRGKEIEREVLALQKLKSGLHLRVDSLISKEAKGNITLSTYKNKIKKASFKIINGHDLNIDNIKYNIFVTDLKKSEIRLHHKNSKEENYYSIKAVQKDLQAKNLTPLMITNAGMFTPTYEPEGLYIENFDMKYVLDTIENVPNTNFYMQPNGVFYVDSFGRAHIKKTSAYKILQDKKLKPKIATQSGPMLVTEGRINPSFSPGSKNLNIRSGIGIINESKVIFAITLEPSNFYDFALFFKEVFGCNDALFLDGAISEMYIKGISDNVIDGHFGPMISIVNKNKK